MENNKEINIQEINKRYDELCEKLVLIELAIKDLTRKVENIPILDDDKIKLSTSSIGIYDRIVNNDDKTKSGEKKNGE